MNVWHSIGGMIKAELVSADPEESFSRISARNIEIHNLHKSSALTYTFLVSRKSERELKELCEKQGDSLTFRKRIGFFWAAKKAVTRPILSIGVLCFLVMALWIPTRVFFVQVEGNCRLPDRQILAAAEACGIEFGASRRTVRSERVKNALLAAIPELQWAGVNTSGCFATISVREKAEPEKTQGSGKISSILAVRDGYVLSGIATAGNLLVKPGDSVQTGQVLISAYTDCGICIRAEQAKGEIIAQTSRHVDVIMPSSVAIKEKTKNRKRKHSLLLRKKRIFLWKDSGIWEGSCGRMYEEYYITLPGGFRLPVGLCVETYYFTDTILMDVPMEEAEAVLKEFAQDYLCRTMVSGKILSGIQIVEECEGIYRLRGDYACVEMIGIMRQEQIGDTNGESS